MDTSPKTVAWIFYAVAMASQVAPAPRRGISEVADGINHAVPTQQELNGSLRLLQARGLVQADGASFSLSSAGLMLLSSARAGNSTVFSVWHALTKAFAK